MNANFSGHSLLGRRALTLQFSQMPKLPSRCQCTSWIKLPTNTRNCAQTPCQRVQTTECSTPTVRLSQRCSSITTAQLLNDNANNQVQHTNQAAQLLAAQLCAAGTISCMSSHTPGIHRGLRKQPRSWHTPGTLTYTSTLAYTGALAYTNTLAYATILAYTSPAQAAQVRPGR